MQNVMLRFPADQPANIHNLFDRTIMCANAQRAFDRGTDIHVPPGVTIVVTQPGLRPSA